MIAPQAHIPAMKNLELTDDEAQALVRVIREAIDSDRFPLSPRIAVLRSILAQLRPEPARAPLPPLRNYVPPSGTGIAASGIRDAFDPGLCGETARQADGLYRTT